MDIAYNELFDNQKLFGKQIIEAFKPGIHSVLAVAPTQSGKTGSILAAMFLSKLPSSHIFLITGLSSVEWVEQSSSRIPIANIFHRNTLHKFIRTVSKIHDAIIFIDECHIASKPDQSIPISLRHISSHRTVYVSATPDMNFFKPNKIIIPGFAIVRMPTPIDYIPIQHFVARGRVLQCKNLCATSEHILEIVPFLNAPKYHIIRTGRLKFHDITIANFKRVLDPEFVFISMPEDINQLLSSPPAVHTFIFIKDTLRCAITIHKQFIGVVYDRFTLYPSYSSVIQGLAGRVTGYHSNLDIIIFSFPDII